MTIISFPVTLLLVITLSVGALRLPPKTNLNQEVQTSENHFWPWTQPQTQPQTQTQPQFQSGSQCVKTFMWGDSTIQADSCATLSPGDVVISKDAALLYQTHAKKAEHADAMCTSECQSYKRETGMWYPLISDKYKFGVLFSPKAMSGSISKSLMACKELDVKKGDRPIPEGYKVLTGWRDPLSRFVAGYTEFMHATFFETNWTSAKDLRACLIAVREKKPVDANCGRVRVGGTPKTGLITLTSPQWAWTDQAHSSARLLEATANSQFYDYPLDVNSPASILKVLEDLRPQFTGCYASFDHQVYFASEHLSSQSFLSPLKADMTIRVEHAEEDWARFLKNLGISNSECQFQHANDGGRWKVEDGNVRADAKVDSEQVKKAILENADLRRQFCNLYLSDLLCGGYEEKWHSLCGK